MRGEKVQVLQMDRKWQTQGTRNPVQPQEAAPEKKIPFGHRPLDTVTNMSTNP